MIVPYTLTPRWAKITERVLLPICYASLIAASVVVLVATVFVQMQIMALSTIVFSVLALVGVLSQRFQIELVALWFIAWSLAIGAISIVELGFTYTGAFIGALAPWLGLRILRLSIVARMARALVE